MLAFVGIVTALGVIMLCGTSPLDKPRSEEDRLNMGIGVLLFTIVLTVVVAVVVG